MDQGFTTEQKIVIVLSHLSIFLGVGIILPIIVLLVSKDKTIRFHAREAIGFQICVIIAAIILGIIGFIGALLSAILIGFPLVILVSVAGATLGIIALVFPIIATVKFVGDGEYYTYPFTSKIMHSVIG